MIEAEMSTIAQGGGGERRLKRRSTIIREERLGETGWPGESKKEKKGRKENLDRSTVMEKATLPKKGMHFPLKKEQRAGEVTDISAEKGSFSQRRGREESFAVQTSEKRGKASSQGLLRRGGGRERPCQAMSRKDPKQRGRNHSGKIVHPPGEEMATLAVIRRENLRVLGEPFGRGKKSFAKGDKNRPRKKKGIGSKGTEFCGMVGCRGIFQEPKF